MLNTSTVCSRYYFWRDLGLFGFLFLSPLKAESPAHNRINLPLSFEHYGRHVNLLEHFLPLSVQALPNFVP